MFILVAGPAGSGKSTLGLELARLLGLPIIDLDTATNPLLEALSPILGDRHWNDASLRDIVRPGRYAALRAVLADQAPPGTGAVAVAPFTLELQGGTEWDELVAAIGEQPTVVWLNASPALLAWRRRQRAADRDAHMVDTSRGAGPRVPHLAIEASLAVPQQLAAIKRSLGSGRKLPADSAIFTRRFTAALFDLDGTLIDSTPAVSRSWLQLAREFEVELDLLSAGHGQPASQVIAASFPEHLAEQALARVTQIEAEELDDVIALAGAQEILANLPPGARAIVTSGTRLIAGNRLRAAGISPPEVVITFDDVSRGKPDPEPFLLAAERLGVDPAACVVFEDAPAGLAAARAAGCMTVAVAGTYQAHELEADLIIDGLYQIAVNVHPDGGFRLAPAPAHRA